MIDIYSYENKTKEQVMIKTDSGIHKKIKFIENFKEGETITELFSVKMKSAPRSYKRGTWFDFTAIDKTGEIAVKFWGGDNKERVKRLYDSFKNGDVIQIRAGTVELYNDQLQISINESSGGIRRCSEDEYLKSDFIATLPEEEIKKLYKELKKYIDEIENIQLKNLIEQFFNDKEFVEKYIYSPSAMVHHHNYIGGNLQHCIGVIRLCKTICEMYPGINKEIVVTGAILHDVGKLMEYSVTTAIDKTDVGNFIGHIVIGDRWIREKINNIRENGEKFDENLEMYLCHLILSHHGKYEYGSPKMPKIAEALVLFQADFMDSQVKNYLQNLEERQKSSVDEWAFVFDSDSGRRRAMYLKNLDGFIEA
jgi:3'-5' exoribonuclease